MDSGSNIFFPRPQVGVHIRVKGRGGVASGSGVRADGTSGIAEVAVVGLLPTLASKILPSWFPAADLSRYRLTGMVRASRMAKFMVPRHIRMVAELCRLPDQQGSTFRVQKLLWKAALRQTDREVIALHSARDLRLASAVSVTTKSMMPALPAGA